MKKKDSEKACYICEHSHEICSGDYFICEKHGVVKPDAFCKKFSFDPLKIKVDIKKMPEFVPMLK